MDALEYGLAATNTPAANKLALSAAIEQAAGGVVSIGSGIYPISPLVITTPFTTLHFAPGATLSVAADSKSSALIDIHADDVTIDGGLFDGAGVAGSLGIMALRIVGSHRRIAIRNCTIRNASCAIGAYNVRGGGDWTIADNRVEGTVKSHGILLHGNPTKGNVSGVSVVGNRIEGSASNGIWVGNGFADVRISGNHVGNAGRMGIEVWRNRGGFILSDNIVDGCRSYGISVAATPRTVAASNIVRRATEFGIEVASCHGVALVGNIVSDVTPGRIKATGISINAAVEDAVGDVVITGGIISGCYAGINLCGGNVGRANMVVSGVLMRDVEYGIRNVGYVGELDGGGTVRRATIVGCTIICAVEGIGKSRYGGRMIDSVIEGNNVQAVATAKPPG